MENFFNWIKSLFMYRPLSETTLPEPPVVPVVDTSAQDTYTEVKQALKPNMIQKWATLISHFEGADPTLNNPGNFKYSTLMASWGGQKARAGSDGGFFCKFPTKEMGFTALCNFLTLGCENQLLDYHNARTIKQFTLVYTNHPKPQFDYSDNLIKQLGVSPDTDIKTFL